MTKYTGLVIGGPLAGKQLEWSMRSYDFTERETSPALAPTQSVPNDEVIRSGTYYHHYIEGVGFWTEHLAPATPRFILDKLCQAYKEKYFEA